jgi:hypothetical protein
MAIPRNLANIAPHVNASSTELVVNDGGANLDFRVEGNGSDNLIFADAGVYKVGIGTNTFNTNGGVLQVANGISFPATQSACADANTLDDYEEGTWTPTANNVTVNSGSPGYSGVYTKIGNIVYVQMFQSGGNITLAGDTFFSGLPFNPSTNNSSPGAWTCAGTNKSGVQYVYEASANLYVSAGISTLTNLTAFRASAVYQI